MKRTFVLVGALLVSTVAVYFLVIRSGTIDKRSKEAPLPVMSDSDPFNVSYASFLLAYYQLKDALVQNDTTSADAAAVVLASAADSIRLDEIKGDSTGAIKELARTFIMEINTSVQYFTREPGIEARRRQFEALTELVWNLTRSIRYTGATIYYQFCPMAFTNRGAYWLSPERQILNPYFGDKMLHCGQVMDSLNYAGDK